jgi:hypothetical protein
MRGVKQMMCKTYTGKRTPAEPPPSWSIRPYHMWGGRVNSLFTAVPAASPQEKADPQCRGRILKLGVHSGSGVRDYPGMVGDVLWRPHLLYGH